MKKYPGIDYGFRPMSYWVDADPIASVLRNVTGENRRQIIIEFLKESRLEGLDPRLLADEVDESTRIRLGQIHPSFLGGEYLPEYLYGEVEIARICLLSTTQDVITLRARPVEQGIAYRVVDEYDGQFTLPIPTSSEPLTLGEVATQFSQGRLHDLEEDCGIALCFNQSNVGVGGAASLRHFTRIDSNIYRQLNRHFEWVFDDWVAGHSVNHSDRS